MNIILSAFRKHSRLLFNLTQQQLRTNFMMSVIPKTVNADLQKERTGASFKSEEFAEWWHGAKELQFKRDLEHLVYDDNTPADDIASLLSKSHEDIYNEAVKDALSVARKMKKLQAERNPGGNDIYPAQMAHPALWGALPAGNPFDLHFTMVLTSIKGQGTKEQIAKWVKRGENLELCGAYAQTELGHGTFLRGLETRADYDAKTQEFVLNSPSLRSYKFWPGGLGHSSNFCLLVAQLYIENESKGVQMFIVPIRDEETHMPLPGVDVGEIGKKIGFHGVNNGYLGLKNVRIPRMNMLMKNAQVLPDGSFKQSPASVLTYFTMVEMRCYFVRNMSIVLGMAATIATRYSAVRRQSPINANEPEPQIMDHVTQQLKLFPEIATCMAYRLTSDVLYENFHETSRAIQQGDFSRLQEMHILSCSMKAMCTYDATAGTERLRLACGGHGYLLSSNLGNLYAAVSAACTYEGENTVLLLQVGRFLIKSWRQALKGKPLAQSVGYFADAVKQKEFGNWTGTWQNIVDAMYFVAANKTRVAYESLVERMEAGQTEGEASNNTGIEYTQAAELHARAFVCASFLSKICGARSNHVTHALKNSLENLLELYLVNTALKQMSDILRFIPLTSADVKELQNRLELVLKKLRPEAVAIVDGFDFHDRCLGSTLGSYDGNAYERLFESAKKSPLNKQPVPKAFHEHLKPFMKSNM